MSPIPVVLAAATTMLAAAQVAGARPNILWITAEDLSPNLGCYGDAYAVTPSLDRFARQAVRYTHAFATAPVCSPARSCLITGHYATSLGTQHLRSLFPIPADVHGFPSRLRAAGYYCSNNVKTDYNTADEPRLVAESWDDWSAQAHWRKRRPEQPFYSVFNLMHTHQSRASVWSFDEFEQEIGARLRAEERHDPARAPVPPYYPDTPTVRRTLARYYDCITAMDREVGRILDELERDGLAEDTIVFFYGDHGMGLPRGKRTLYDSGLRVPLLLRFPGKFRHLAPADPGESVDRLVSFVDFAPTVLSLAAVSIPPNLQGHAFLGNAAASEREYVWGARDRVDEAYDLSRSVRDRRYLYIRNYLPFLSLNQPEGYSDQALMRQEITRLAAEGKLDAASWSYARPAKPLEELYDTLEDPHQMVNLAALPHHRDLLNRMREAQQRWIRETLDLGFLPEAEWWARIQRSCPWAVARDGDRYPADELIAAAGLVGHAEAVDRQVRLLGHRDAGVRYWAVVGLRAAGPKARDARAALEQALEDPSASVRIEAAATLAALGAGELALPVLTRELQSAQLDVVLHASRSLQLLGDSVRPAMPVLREILEQARAQRNAHPLWLFIEFSLSATLERG